MRTAWGYKRENGIAHKQYVEESRTSLDYWLAEGSHFHPFIQPIALRIFSLIAGTGGVERVNSAMGFQHSKLRNNLGDVKVSDIVYINQNHSCLDTKNNEELAALIAKEEEEKEKDEDEEEEEEEEEEDE